MPNYNTQNPDFLRALLEEMIKQGVVENGELNNSDETKDYNDYQCKACKQPNTLRAMAVDDTCAHCGKLNPGWTLIIASESENNE